MYFLLILLWWENRQCKGRGHSSRKRKKLQPLRLPGLLSEHPENKRELQQQSRLQTVLLQARGEVPQCRHNETQSFTSSHRVQLAKATMFRQATENFTKTANVALGLLKIHSHHQPSTNSVLFKACHQITTAT